MADEEAESTLLQIRECFVYKIPPRQTNALYKYVSARFDALGLCLPSAIEFDEHFTYSRD